MYDLYLLKMLEVESFHFQGQIFLKKVKIEKIIKLSFFVIYVQSSVRTSIKGQNLIFTFKIKF